MADVQPDSNETHILLEQCRQGDDEALNHLLARYRSRMESFVDNRIDARLRARIDPSDVVQEAQMEMARRMDDYLERRPMPFHLWAYRTVHERLLSLQRDHRQTDRRSVNREVMLPARSSLLLAKPFLKSGTSPSRQLQKKELKEQIDKAIAQLSENDCQILLMRHVEDLSYEEIACVLDIESAAARKRYGRALIRLQRVLSERGLLE